MQQLDFLSTQKASGTSLVSYYIKGGINQTGQKLTKEISQAEISNQKILVKQSLLLSRQSSKPLRTIPISLKMGSLSLQVMSIAFSLEPPIPITRTDYICDKCFHLDAIKALYHEQPYYAVIMLTARSSELWLVNDLHKKKISGIDLSLTNSHKKGGQSQARFDRLFQNKRDHNDSFLIEAIIDTYYDFSTNKPKVVGFIIGGHAETRIRVGKELDILDDYIVCNIACEHLDVYHLWNASRQYRDDFILSKSTRIITEIEELIRTTPEMLDFGVEVEKAIGHNIYSKVYSGKEITSDTGKCQIILVDPAWIGQYGHFIGVRFMSEE